MEYLPRDVKYELLEKMTYPDLMKMCQVSKEFKRICQQQEKSGEGKVCRLHDIQS